MPNPANKSLKKYYVQTGDIQTVILGANPQDAAIRAILKTEDDDNVDLGQITMVSERGFKIHPTDVCLYTDYLLDVIDQSDFYPENLS